MVNFLHSLLGSGRHTCDEEPLLRPPRRRGGLQVLGRALDLCGQHRRLSSRTRKKVVCEGLRVVGDAFDILDDCAACDERRIEKSGA